MSGLVELAAFVQAVDALNKDAWIELAPTYATGGLRIKIRSLSWGVEYVFTHEMLRNANFSPLDVVLEEYWEAVMSRSTQLDRIAELVQHELDPGYSVRCSVDPSDGSSILVFRRAGAAFGIHLSAACTAKFMDFNGIDLIGQLRGDLEEIESGD